MSLAALTPTIMSGVTARRPDEVVFLPDWQESQGAKLEMALCQYIKKRIAFLPES